MSEDAAPPSIADGHVPDLSRKLKLLLKTYGGKVRDGRSGYVQITTQQRLAAALGADPARISEWKAGSRILNLSTVAPRIAQIFFCDEKSFRQDSYDDFARKMEGRNITWQRLVASADIAGVIEKVPLPPPALLLEHAFPDGVGLGDADLPVLAPGTKIKVTFPTPMSSAGRSHWAGWHLLAFSGDRDGYLNWMPRYRASKAFRGLEKVPPAYSDIQMPAVGGELRVAKLARDEHEIVLVVSREPYPERLLELLSADAKDEVLEPTLAVLATWLAPRLDSGDAKILRRPYFVGEQPAAPDAGERE